MLVAILLIWQGVQLLYIGAIGVPGFFLIPLTDPFAAPPQPQPQQRDAAPRAYPDAPGNLISPTPQASAEKPAEQTTKTATIPSSLPSTDEIKGWVKSQAREFVGGVDDAGNILYRFDVWLEPPADQKQRIAAVDYAFDAPSATPATRASADRESGFRVHFGGLSCARSLAVTVTFDNGETREAEVNGCRALD